MSTFLWRLVVHPNGQLVTSHHSLSTNLSLHPSPDLTKFLTWNLMLLKSGEGCAKDLGALTCHQQTVLVHGWSSQFARMLIESEIEILWQIFLRKVDSETIFLTRYSIESSNMSLAEFEADWRILAIFFGSISRSAWPIDWWAFATFSLF